MLALCQLIQLRDCYNDGWKPNWKDIKEYKYGINYYQNCISIDLRIDTNAVLTFKTPKLRDEFLKNFKDLIEIAKPLL